MHRENPSLKSFHTKGNIVFRQKRITIVTFLLFSFLLLFLESIHSQTKTEIIVDPLLQKPWIPDAEEEESRSYHRFLSEFKNKHSSVKKRIHLVVTTWFPLQGKFVF